MLASRSKRLTFRRHLAALAGFFIGVGFAACGPNRTCTADAQCGAGAICLASHVCAATCQSDAECGPGERCTLAGVCRVPSDVSCSSNADCPSGVACFGGFCGGRGADGGSLSCGGQKFDFTRTESNVLVVLDHSGSMMETINGVAKWDSAAAGVRTLTQRHGDGIRFGLSIFSWASMTCHPGQVVVPAGPSTAAAIAGALPMDADGHMTPIAGALMVAGGSPSVHDPARSNALMLITDGKENCGGDPEAQVRGLHASGIRTYVVGFGGEVDQARLNGMAIEGGTARTGSRRYYQVDQPAALDATLSAIAAGAASCDFHLAQTPPDPTKLSVAVDGTWLPVDPSQRTGYTYDPATNRLQLHGPACDLYANTPGAKLSVIYGCPDETLVEVGPGGRPDGGIDLSVVPGGPGSGTGIPGGGTGGGSGSGGGTGTGGSGGAGGWK